MSEKESIEQMNSQMRDMLSRINELTLMTMEVKACLVGSDLHPIGVIKDIQDLKDEVKELKDYRKSIRWTATGLLIGAGYGGFKMIQGLIKWLSEQ